MNSVAPELHTELSMRSTLVGALAALLCLLPAAPAKARFEWRHILDCLGRGASCRVTEGEPARVSGHYRPRDGSIWVYRGPHPLRTLVHELLHRATARRPENYAREITALTGVLQIDEGLTAYYADRALERAAFDGLALPMPAAGTPYRALRAWSREVRRVAADVLRTSFGIEVLTTDVHMLSENSFRRAFERQSGRIWVKPDNEPSYPMEQKFVRQLVQLVGEEPLRRAYFEADVEGLREALRQARDRTPRRQFPASIDLR